MYLYRKTMCRVESNVLPWWQSTTSKERALEIIFRQAKFCWISFFAVSQCALLTVDDGIAHVSFVCWQILYTKLFENVVKWQFHNFKQPQEVLDISREYLCKSVQVFTHLDEKGRKIQSYVERFLKVIRSEQNLIMWLASFRSTLGKVLRYFRLVFGSSMLGGS